MSRLTPEDLEEIRQKRAHKNKSGKIISRILYFAVIALLTAWAYNIGTNSSYKGSVEWYDFESGMRLAQTSNKPAFIVVKADWCGKCGQYSRILNDPKIQEAFDGVVPIVVDFDTEKHHMQKHGIKVKAVPSTFLVKRSGELILRPKYKNAHHYTYWSRDKDYIISLLEKVKKAK